MTYAATSVEQIDPTQHLKLVSKVAKKYVGNNVPIADTIEYSSGILGLLSAAKTFDPDKHKTKFSTYAYDCINKSIIQNWRNQKCAKRSPVNQFSIHDAETEIELYDYRSPKKYDKAINIMFKDHPNDSEKDKRNKKILYDHFVNEKTWTEISEEFQVTKTCVQQYGMAAVELLKIRFGVKNFKSIEEFSEEF